MKKISLATIRSDSKLNKKLKLLMRKKTEHTSLKSFIDELADDFISKKNIKVKEDKYDFEILE